MSWKYRADEANLLTTGMRGIDINLGFESLTEARTLTAADCGKTFLLNLAGGFNVNLPNVAGFFCKFIVATAPTTDYTITAGTADTMAGSVVTSATGAADTEAAATGDVLTFVANTAVVGDRAEVFCDGSKAYVFAICSAAGGATITG